MTLVLRSYQQKDVDKVISLLKQGYKRILLVEPTGAGKTAIATDLTKRCTAKENGLFFICHRTELIDQTYATFKKNEIECAFIQGGRKPDTNKLTQIASISSLVRRLDDYAKPRVCIWDECFVGDTLVNTANGYVKIKDISKNDIVCTYNEETKELEYKKVIKVIKKLNKKHIYEVRINNKTTLCTEDHLFFTKKGWTKAKNLDNLDMVLTITKEQGDEILNWSRVESSKIQEQRYRGQSNELRSTRFVYDLTVEDNHNYFANDNLVHNCHHIASNIWSKVFDAYEDIVHIGLTATPVRLDGKGLGNYYDAIVIGPSIQWLIDNKHLVPFQYYAPSQINRKEIKKSNGDYSKKALVNASFGSKIIGDNVEHYKKYAMGKRNVVFAMNVKHSQEIAERYNTEGIPAKHLDGTTPKDERKQAIADFASGKIKVLTNVDLFGEGFDLPAIEVVSLLRPTMSLALFLQWCGRGLRTCPEIGKELCLIFDHANNYEEHGFPNEDREWGLEPPKKRSKREDDSLAIRRCPECFFAHRVSLKCPSCGFVYGSDGESIIEVAGELVVVGSSDYKKAVNKELQEVKTFREFVKTRACKGMSMHKTVGWWSSRTEVNLKDSLEGLQEIERVYKYKNGWARIQWQRAKAKNKGNKPGFRF